MKHLKKTKRNLFIFITIVVLSGWAGRGIDVLLGVSSLESPGTLLWLVAPIITTVILRTFAGDGWRDLGLHPRLKKNLKWYGVAMLIFPFVTVTTILIGKAFGWITTESYEFRIFLPVFVGALLFNFVKNIPEEFVWQGYLTPKLLKFKLTDLKLYLIVGLVWGVWHIPYYLYFLSRDQLESFTSLNLSIVILLSIIIMIFWSISFVELRRLTNSVWPIVLLHTLEDGFNVLLIHQYINITPSKELIISPVYGVVGVALHVIIGLSLRHIRKKKELNKQ